jgi:hypothetical protein
VGRSIVKVDGRDFELTLAGGIWLKEIGIDWQALERKKRLFAPQCLDWTERRYHIAGALGSALLARMFELGWLKKAWAPRLVKLTAKGQIELKRRLALVVTGNASKRVKITGRGRRAPTLLITIWGIVLVRVRLGRLLWPRQNNQRYRKGMR